MVLKENYNILIYQYDTIKNMFNLKHLMKTVSRSHIQQLSFKRYILIESNLY